MFQELSGLQQNERDYDKDRKAIGDFMRISRETLGLSPEDVVLMTQIPLDWVEKAERGCEVPRYARDILVTFYDYIVSYTRISAYSKNEA